MAKEICRRTMAMGILTMGCSAAIPCTSAAIGTTRTLHITSPHTGETVNVMYHTGSYYIPEALAHLDTIFRDWRTGEEFPISIATLDILSRVQNFFSRGRPIVLLSGYRSRETNEMLRKKSEAVSKRSLHMLGLAADIRIDGVDIEDVANAAVKSGVGGLGLYHRSNFIHIDSGPHRKWFS